MNDALVIMFILGVLNVLGLFIVFCKSNVGSVIILSVFSIFSVGLYLLLRAPDVALTEAAIGICIGTVIIISFLRRINEDKAPISFYFGSSLFFLLLIACGYLLATYISDFGSQSTPANSSHIIRYYTENASNRIKIDSLVASILASFRGFDTFGETLVIYTAMLCVCMVFDSNEGVRNARK
ncbi:MAG: DUF4040 domain-containing protein [Rickettsiales bacterium]